MKSKSKMSKNCERNFDYPWIKYPDSCYRVLRRSHTPHLFLISFHSHSDALAFQTWFPCPLTFQTFKTGTSEWTWTHGRMIKLNHTVMGNKDHMILVSNINDLSPHFSLIMDAKMSQYIPKMSKMNNIPPNEQKTGGWDILSPIFINKFWKFVVISLSP